MEILLIGLIVITAAVLCASIYLCYTSYMDIVEEDESIILEQEENSHDNF